MDDTLIDIENTMRERLSDWMELSASVCATLDDGACFTTALAFHRAFGCTSALSNVVERALEYARARSALSSLLTTNSVFSPDTESVTFINCDML